MKTIASHFDVVLIGGRTPACDQANFAKGQGLSSRRKELIGQRVVKKEKKKKQGTEDESLPFRVCQQSLTESTWDGYNAL